MVIRELEYVDFMGIKRKEQFMFNFTDAELLEMELTAEGGLEAKMKRLISLKDQGEIIKIFKNILFESYGVRSLDGKYFEKSEELSKKFAATTAYSKLFMTLAQNADEAAKFVNELVKPVEAIANQPEIPDLDKPNLTIVRE